MTSTSRTTAATPSALAGHDEIGWNHQKNLADAAAVIRHAAQVNGSDRISDAARLALMPPPSR